MLFCPVPFMGKKIVVGIAADDTRPSDDPVVTFATIDAAATDRHSASPLMMERSGNGTAEQCDRIDEETIRLRRDRAMRPTHGQARRFQNVEPVDFLFGRDPIPMPTARSIMT